MNMQAKDHLFTEKNEIETTTFLKCTKTKNLEPGLSIAYRKVLSEEK